MTKEKTESESKVRDLVRRDRPLQGNPHPHHRLHPQMYFSELVGTTLLVFLGLSIVIALWGHDAPLGWVPIPADTRRLLTGFLFGTVGAAIAFSPIGKMSGAHINPAVTFAFWLEGKLRWRDAGFYVLAQLIGGALGATALFIWGGIGASDAWGASLPMNGVPVLLPIAGETLCTFLLVLLIFVCAAHKVSQPFTPLINPPLFALLTWLEAPLSGASANPARSFGPELAAWLWQGWWIYWIGPCLGAGLAVLLLHFEALRHHRPIEARLFHFGHHGATGESGASQRVSEIREKGAGAR
ncbi:MAG: aquaporin [Verrucomicrobia bacterium]|nr:aquaporin [Verrucomicrobiota bacterium]